MKLRVTCRCVSIPRPSKHAADPAAAPLPNPVTTLTSDASNLKVGLLNNYVSTCRMPSSVSQCLKGRRGSMACCIPIACHLSRPTSAASASRRLSTDYPTTIVGRTSAQSRQPLKRLLHMPLWREGLGDAACPNGRADAINSYQQLAGQRL